MSQPKDNDQDNIGVARAIILTYDALGLDPEDAKKMAQRAIENLRLDQAALKSKAPVGRTKRGK